MLKPQDVLVGLKASTIPQVNWSFAEMATMTGLSVGAVFASARRCKQAGLMSVLASGSLAVQGKNLLDFLVHGMPVVFFAERGEVVKGIPTGRSGRRDVFPAAANEIPLVWEHEAGSVRGESLKPLYPSVPEVASRDNGLYELLVNCDLLRVGSVREKAWAAKAMQEFLTARGLY
jgi:hypothetical protein